MQDNYQELSIVLVVVPLIFLVLTFIIVFIVLFYQKKKFKHGKQLIQMEKTYAEAMLESKLEIQEETFKNISQEIHDNIGQALTFVKLTLHTLNLRSTPEDEYKLDQSRTLLTQAIQDLRDISKTLHTDFIQQTGISDAIEQQLAILQKSGHFQTEFLIEGIPYRFDVHKELLVFRVVQELLNNIVKHAKASWIKIEIAYQRDALVIQIRDNGHGFDLDTLDLRPGQGQGLGLRNMLNRMTLINGDIQINSIPGDGTRALITLPNDKT
jgi:two-component system, NarL family, sensor kinase